MKRASKEEREKRREGEKHVRAWIKDTAAPAPAGGGGGQQGECSSDGTAVFGTHWIRTPLHAGGGVHSWFLTSGFFQEKYKPTPIVVMTQELEHQNKTQKST